MVGLESEICKTRALECKVEKLDKAFNHVYMTDCFFISCLFDMSLLVVRFLLFYFFFRERSEGGSVSLYQYHSSAHSMTLLEQ